MSDGGSTIDRPSLLGGATRETDLQHRMLEIPQKLWERGWVAASELINPLVVKEIRQSLKSRHFTISFGLVLIAAISWTLILISLSVPRIYYIPGGQPLLAGYFCILAVPLMVIIPFSAYRSLTAETEDSTFELLSISALSADQIVSGKMASALVQILLYLSALAPCIVLTYLLRGVGLFTILFLLGLTVAFSIGETALALMFAAVGRTRLLQNLVSVLVLAGLLIGVFSWLSLLIGAGLDNFSNPPSEIYLVLFAIATIFVTLVSLVLRAAAAAIDFPSENHSTPLRLRIIGAVALILFWSLVAIVASREAAGAIVLLVGLFIALMTIGALITGEYGVISPRAQRTLPKTFLGRVFLTWLYPGAGLGYIYIVCLFTGAAFTVGALELYYYTTLDNFFGSNSVVVAGYMLVCYLAIYLGVNRLLLLAVPKHMPARMLASFALLVVLLIFAHLLPLVVVYYLNDYREFAYDWHQAFNIIWSIDEAIDNASLGSNFLSFSGQFGTSIVLLTLCAIGVFGLNLILCTRDVLLVRVSIPPRVREEDKEEAPEEPAPIDPFAIDA